VSDSIGLKTVADYYRFIDTDFVFYSRHYLKLIDASQRPVEGLERVHYNAQQGFTLQFMLLLAPLTPDDPDDLARQKIGIVAHYLDIMLARRIWIVRRIAYSTMQYTMLLVMRDIRRLDPQPLAQKLHDLLAQGTETFSSNERLRVHQQNRYALHRVLARLTDYVETQSGQPSRYSEFVREGGNRYEVEHIWADHPRRHSDEFGHAVDFDEYRNRIGGLLLLPKKFNARYGDLPYEKKLPHYNTQNLLARSLHPQAYDHNPGFLQFIQRSGMDFRPNEVFKKADLDEGGDLYRQLAQQVWNPNDLYGNAGR
jgi:hypothetical protein